MLIVIISAATLATISIAATWELAAEWRAQQHLVTRVTARRVMRR